ncbi:MAG: ketopantoate reductase family protein [Propionibacteriaceae bacterium]|jgi:2-dehydropantoate 2-reductase|nr:ketopantoate reductase family protein [Propionibacteriaceae bacterium]
MVRISVIGLGAMGASYAAKLQDAPDTDVRVIATGARAEGLRREGVTVNGKRHDFTIVAPDDTVEPADLLIVAVKHMALPEALPQVSRHISDHTVIVSLLNGITSEAQIAEAYPQSHPLLSITFGIDAVRHGHEVSYSSLGKMAFGEAVNEPPYSEQAQWLARLFDAAGLAYEIPTDMVRQLWWKFLVNTGVNQITGVLEAPYRIVQDPASPARDVMIAAQREVVAVARAQGVDLDESDIDSWLDVLDGLGPTQYTSMAQDTLAHRRCETDIFGGMVHRLGEEAGIPTPVNASLWGLLKAKELL